MVEDKTEELNGEYLCKRERCPIDYFTPIKPDMPGDYVAGICKKTNARIYFNDICKCL